MRIGAIDVVPIAAESLGVRSLCTRVETPDVRILFDPSAALAQRFRLEPHPLEYLTLRSKLNEIRMNARQADILSISHYHYDHVRPGFFNMRYNFSSREELKNMFREKTVLAKDNRARINPSQRRRGYYFEKDLKGVVKEIKWADAKTFDFGNTTLVYSEALPHGEENSRLGFVLATTITHGQHSVLFAPDLQGPIVETSLNYLLSQNPDLLIVGGPPNYLTHHFSMKQRDAALKTLMKLAQKIQVLVVDHHLLRGREWEVWLESVISEAEQEGNVVHTMASLSGKKNTCLEARRKELYTENPPPKAFMDWVSATEQYKKANPPPLE